MLISLEAGDDVSAGRKEVSEPMKYGASFATTLNWGFGTTPQPGAGGRHIRCTRGRGVGGSSLVNGMLFNRGAREIYDQWAKGGAFGWAADDCLPYFKRYEDNSRGASEAHGQGGDVRVSDIPAAMLSPIATVFHEACLQAGHAKNPDQNSLIDGQPQDGVQICASSVRAATSHCRLRRRARAAAACLSRAPTPRSPLSPRAQTSATSETTTTRGSRQPWHSYRSPKRARPCESCPTRT